MRLKLSLIALISAILIFPACSDDSGSGEGEGGDSTATRQEAPPIQNIKKYKITADDDQGRLVEEEFFNEDGKLVKDVDYIFDGTERVWQTTVYTYDDQGRHLTERAEDLEGNVWESSYTYDENNKLATESVIDPEGEFMFEYVHDEKGNLTQSIKKDTKGNILKTSTTRYEYDAEGNIVVQESWSTDKKGKEGPHMTLKFVYDGNGNPITEEEYDGDGNLIESVQMKYDDKGREIETTETRNGEFNLKMISEYDEFGDLIKEVGYESNPDKPTYTETYEFDEYGTEIKSWYEHEDGTKYGERSVITYKK